MSTRAEDLASGLGRFLSAKWGTDVAVGGLAHIPGGASRETWRLEARTNGAGARGLIVRIDPPTSLIDTDRRTEYRAMEAAHRAGIPTPEPLFLEESRDWIGRPFSISAEVPGCQASAEAIPPDHRAAMGRQKWRLLGQIAALDLDQLALGDVMTATTREHCALEQLDYWAKVIVDDELHPNPVAHAAIRWLRRNPPPPAKRLCLVHGDFRTGNFLFAPDGEIRAILDWEMAHIGDPLEDLAWSLDPLWCWPTPELAGRLLPHREAVRAWEDGSGLKVDPVAFRWWQVFAAVKGIGIWISSSEDFHAGQSKLPILAVAGWLMTDRQQRILADYLSPHSRRQFVRDVA